MEWPDFLLHARQTSRRPLPDAPGVLLSLDPGETLGWCEFRYGQLARTGQRRIKSFRDFEVLIQNVAPDVIVCENYKVYAHKAAEHIGSEVVTVQYIGAIKLIAQQRGIPVVLQMASQAKGFATDQKLRGWSLYQTNKRHANDAIRHACYYLLFG